MAVPVARFALLTTLLFVCSPLRAQNLRPDEFVRLAPKPADYILQKARDHRVIFIGEAHWIRHDVELIQQLIPRLPSAGVTTLAMEILPASEQSRLDSLVHSPTWDNRSAMAIMRKAEFPYREYLGILQAVWRTNQQGGNLQMLALGPGVDWREILLPQAKDYDSFMADRILEHLSNPSARIIVYAGLNHCFTRFYQPELPRASKVEAFMDRTGNKVWRQIGEEAFLIILHHPFRCRVNGKLSRCLPADGAIDCAAKDVQGGIGFDLAGSPFAEARLRGFEYALGYPDLRLVDISDGYVWIEPISRYTSVTLIPLDEFAPDEAALREVSSHSPFSDEKNSTTEQLQQQWKDQQEWLERAQTTRGWAEVATHCQD